MNKLNLRLDDLAVESFPTTPEERDGARGTVHGFVKTQGQNATCGPEGSCETCDYMQSCYCAITAFGNTCVETCYETYCGTCQETCLTA